MPEALLAEIDGILVRDGDCVYISERGAPVLPVWPADARLEGDVVVRGKDRIAAIGERVHFAGGFLPFDAVRRTMNADLPETCQIGNYFLINGNAKPCNPVLVRDAFGNNRLECSG